MNYYNYNNRFSGFNQSIPQIPQMPKPLQPQLPQFNAQQFTQMATSLNPNMLNILAQLARAQGISEQDINSGMEYIKKLV